MTAKRDSESVSLFFIKTLSPVIPLDRAKPESGSMKGCHVKKTKCLNALFNAENLFNPLSGLAI